ncbi:protein CIP2A [Stigmatopora argus]
MANLCRDNYAVQSYIKSLDGVKAFNRTLLNFLNHKNLTVVVFTLSVLVSLTLNEKIGEKLFDAHNIHQTFQLIFNLIANGDSDGALTRKYAVDLLVDLLLNPKMADYLTRYQHFSACASRVSEVLRLKDADSAAKVLELLLAMCGVSGLRPQLCRVFFKPATVLRRPEGKVEPGPALVRWLRSPVAGAEACWPKAMRLLRELLEEALGPDGAIEGARSFAEMVLPVLLDFVKGADADLRRHCDRVSHVNDVLLVMCGEAPTRALLSYHLGAHQCLSQVETLLAGCHGDGPSADEGLGQVCAEALLGTLELMSKLRQQVEDMETSFSRALQDQRIVTPLALALTSPHRKHVRSGMALLLEAATLPDFPSLVLAESVAANNAYRQRATGLSDKCVAALDASTHGGLQVQAQAKEPHVSDIIDLYEQKLASKESRLRDALEAKASASSQVARCHVQEARAEAEGRRLAGLLKEAERRREDLQAELSVQLEQVRLTRADMAELLRRNARQQLVSEEHQDLKAAYNTLLDRFNESERLLQELRTAHADLDQRHQALKDDRQALQTQHDKTAALLEDREKELSSVELRKRQLEDQLGDHLARLAMIHTLTVGDKHNQVQK